MKAGTARTGAVLFAWMVLVATKLSAQVKSTFSAQASVQTSTFSDPEDDAFCNVQYPAEYERQILYALSYYPELNEVKIIFKKMPITTTLNCKPKISSLWGGKSKRVYVIGINNKKEFSGILFSEIPPEGQIGIIGHELAHIKDYQSRSIFGVMDRGIDYLHGRSKAKFERAIDTMTIQAGMGEYLHRWAHYAIYESNASEKYKRFKRKIYLAPEEIIGLVAE